MAMFAILHALGVFVADLFKSRGRLEAENLLSFPKILSGLDSRAWAESSHHDKRCLQFCTPSQS
jgi:hypothetical protein